MVNTSLTNPFGLHAQRYSTILFGLLIALLIVFGTASSAAASAGYVTIINLTGKTISVATAQFEPGVNNSGLAYVPQNSMRFNAWTNIEPGKSHDFSVASFYVEQGGSRISWSNRTELVGLVHPTSAVKSVRITSGSYGVFNATVYLNELARFMNANPAYKRVTYQWLDQGRYSVSSGGTARQAYRVYNKTFYFDFRSRDPHLFKECYSVPGTVVDYEFSAQRLHGPRDTWSTNTSSICLGVSVVGNQPYWGAAREQGYFVGNVTVYYTVRSQ